MRYPVFVALLSVVSCATQPPIVLENAAQAIANPEAIDGRLVEVCGYLDLHIEADVVCDDPTLAGACLRIDIGDNWSVESKKYQPFNGKYVCAQGTFAKVQLSRSGASTENGHLVVRFGPYFHRIEDLRSIHAK